MNKKKILVALGLICASIQLNAMEPAWRLKFVNKTFADLLIFTAQRPGSDPIIVGKESEVLSLNPGEKMFFGSPRGTSLLEIQDKALVQAHLTVGKKVLLQKTSETCVTIEVDKDGYTSFKKGIEGITCNESGIKPIETCK